MAHWTAQVFVNSDVGRITAEVEASTISGAKQQIYAKYGNVQSITNLRQVHKSSSNSSGGLDDNGGGTIALIGLIAAGWAFFTFTPWILMGLGGAAGTWIGEKVTRMSVEEYSERDDDSGHGKAAIILTLALILGGVGFVKGSQIKADFDKSESSHPAKIQQAK